MNTICPWCQTEIVWDEELGPEEECPHCNNELTGYRTLQIQIDENADENDSEVFEASVEKVLDSQQEAPECIYCREYMLLAGEQTVRADSFKPNVPASLGQPVLEAPFRLHVYVCPGCFQVNTVLSDEDRQRMIQRLIR
ncbi:MULTISPECIES: hypothetical protein [unclassified Paenibacillus]|uniref:hypothetical protein n=1 Tax=unclassified Paenibacillus TaxID=185978 RepID=UPI001C0F5CD3|nr:MULTISPECIES: hypothetical protein [unclassified Paenibacillus]MBU5442796.1 hypothetical protein [Paenibacillus sp. MSJ-34]CAH0117869.1 hypothetical protein PAE9249_00331 [Paenibacillus sp. CECT 9249]